MSGRKEVFQTKVLQRLYPAPPEVEKVPPCTPESAIRKPLPKVKCIADKVSGDGGTPALPGRRVYSVLPPPEDCRVRGGDGSVTLPEPGDINTEGAPADEDACEVDGEEPRKRRRRRKRKPDAGPGGGAVAGVTEELSPRGGDAEQWEAEERGSGAERGLPEGAGRVSRNKRRKLKKKRRKEKLLSLGLVPRAAPVEFTYQRCGEGEAEEEEEDEEERARRATEVLDFLTSTHEIYILNRPSAAGRPHIPPGAVETLLGSLCSGATAPGELTRLRGLKRLVLLGDAERLAGALEDFQREGSAMPQDDVSVICTLFRYWITDVLPMQQNTRGRQQAAQPL